MDCVSSFCFVFSVRNGCLMIGWYDIVYGASMTLLYLLSIYSGYFNVNGFYKYALWLDFVFTIVQLLGGVFLIYAVKNKSTELVLLCGTIDVLLIGADIVGDVLLGLSFSQLSLEIYIPAAMLLLFLVCVRGYMTLTVFSYYKALKEGLKGENLVEMTA